MQNPTQNGRGHRPLPRLLSMAALLLALPLAACDIDELLNIRDPDVADPTTLADSSALPAWRAATIGDFAVSYDGQDAQITYSGMLADEFINSETFPTRIEVDIRTMKEDNSNIQTLTRNLYRARTTAERAQAAYRQFSPNNIGLAEMFNIAGVTYILFGENYCSGVPFSRVTPEGNFEFGGRENTTEIFQRAVVAADSALAAATRAVLPATAAGTNARNLQLNFARVLKGRALLNLNQPAAAAAAVADVPTSFSYGIFHSENTARENNGVFVFNAINRRIAVANNEGGNGLDYRAAHTAGDPRTPWDRAASGAASIGFDNSTPLWRQQKYPNRSATTPVATGQEARLIQAEAALRAGNFAGAGGTLEILNALRAGASGLPDLTDPGTEADRVNMLFRERAFWTWLTAHRLGDLRRLVRQYGRPQNTVFPTGVYHKNTQGGTYGSDVNLPLSVDERNNPELAGIPSNVSLCLDRNA